MVPTIILLTFNSESTLSKTLRAASQLSDDIFVIDSFSSDSTLEIARMFGAKVLQHPFLSYGAQRNWSIEQVQTTHRWQLHLDADEVMSPGLISEIAALPEDSGISGFLLPRYLRFLGKDLRHGGMSPTWHLRLFPRHSVKCEARLYDQHFYLLEPGKVAKLKNAMVDNIAMTLSEWTVRHNKWADLEAEEQSQERYAAGVQPRLFGSPIERKRFLREMYNLAPLFTRPFGLFFYRYFIRLGLLDGKAGLVFWVLQTFWFRFLIDAKLFEASLHKSDVSSLVAEGMSPVGVTTPAQPVDGSSKLKKERL
jgi:glycosyltransferase involved in cell wall biosynthesis